MSLYNETDGTDINPTPVVGMLGLADPMPKAPPRLDRAEAGMEIWLIGPEPSDNLAGSYLERLSGPARGRPTAADTETGLAVIDEAVRMAHLVPVLHDVSDGGLAVAVAEICIASGIGAELGVTGTAALFGEDPHRFVAVVEPGWAPPALGRRIGAMGGESLTIGDESVAVADLARGWHGALPGALGR